MNLNLSATGSRVALVAVLLALGGGGASAELVYENNAGGNIQATPSNSGVRVDDRTQLRQVLDTSEKAQSTLQATPVQQPSAVQVYAPVVQTQTSAVAQPQVSVVTSGSEVENLSKTEMMRRQRVREELKNEDILSERLEELRLRDEKRRTDQLLGAQSAEVAPLPAPIAAQPIVTETVVTSSAAPIPAPQTIQNQPTVASYNPQSMSTVQSEQIATSRAMNAENSDHTVLILTPKAGLSSMSVDGLDVRGHFSAGLNVGLEASDNVDVLLGYQYSEFGIAPANYGAYYGNNFELNTFKQNLFDGGLKILLLGSEAKLRPFLGGGGAYSKGFVNLSQQLTGPQNLSPDYNVSQFLGYLSAGLDVRVNRSLRIGGDFRYYSVLSSRENQPFQYNDYRNQVVGAAVAQSSFYSITAGASFIF